MTDHQTEAERHMERLVEIAMDCTSTELAALNLHDMECVLNARLEMVGLMLLLGLLLAAGLRPQP